MTALILASASPRRAELLRAAGIPFEVVVSDVDESSRLGESPEAYVRRLAEAKAHAVARKTPDRFVLGADTIVVAGRELLGKPKGTIDARRMLRVLSGGTHEVVTGVCLTGPGARGERFERTAVAVTHVTFTSMTDEEIDWYTERGEPLDKAGAYAIQGLASRFVSRIEGSYSNVVGLPVSVVYDLCRDAGIQVS